MSGAIVQSVNSNGTAPQLTGVVVGNTGILASSFYKNPTGGSPETTPTDSQGTWSIASADTPTLFGGASDIAAGIFFQGNMASGTHTLTLQSGMNTRHNSFMEVSGLIPDPFDVAKSKGSNAANLKQLNTGITNPTNQDQEFQVIAFTLGASTGANPVGIKEVPKFAVQQLVNNNASDLAVHHSYCNVFSKGSQTAEENWIATETTIAGMACIATFKCLTNFPTARSRQKYLTTWLESRSSGLRSWLTPTAWWRRCLAS